MNKRYNPQNVHLNGPVFRLSSLIMFPYCRCPTLSLCQWSGLTRTSPASTCSSPSSVAGSSSPTFAGSSSSSFFLQVRLWRRDLCLVPQFRAVIFRNKPAAQGAGADPSRCNSTNRLNPPIQQNCRNSWTSYAIWIPFKIYNLLKFSNIVDFFDWKHHLQLLGRVCAIKIFSQRMTDWFS